MNWLTIIFVYVLNMRTREDIIKVKKIYLLENDFWDVKQSQFRTDEGYLYTANIVLENENCLYDKSSCYCLKFNNHRYIKLSDNIAEFINNFLKSPEVDRTFLKFCYSFTDEPIKDWCNLKNYKVKVQELITYRHLEKTTENVLSLRRDELVIHIFHMKKMFETFVYMKPLKFDEYVEFDVKTNLKDEANFNLYYFKNYSECLYGFEIFIKELRHFNLIDDTIFKSQFSKFEEIFIDKTTTLKASHFMDRFGEQIDEKLKTIKFTRFKNETKWFVSSYLEDFHRTHNVLVVREPIKNLRLLFDGCCSYLKDAILNNEVLLPIGGKYNIDYYLEKLSNIIYNLVIQENIDEISKPENIGHILCHLIDSFVIQLEKLQINVLKDFCETEYIHKHFPEVFKKEIKTLDDYIKVENMMCDYYNILTYFFNLYLRKSNPLFVYSSPVFIDKYNIEIIDGIGIMFDSLFKLGQVKAFNKKGKEVIIEKSIDYFVVDSVNLYCPSFILKKKNINEIEVTSSNDRVKKKFKINRYLSF